MTERATITADGNEAVASIAHRVSEVIAIYPITPASAMGELADEWSSSGRPNLWGSVPLITEMQSEAGAAGAVHGALQAGALATTFTASQGLLLMIPNLYKIAGELTPFCLHVAARTIATHALSIFCDHSDVMACRGTGFALLASGSVQEAHDLAAIAHAATLQARVPFLHFFDGFRTSHELTRIEPLDDDTLRGLIDDDAVAAHRARALTPDRPVLRGTAQNPDTFFQAREASNTFYDACPEIVQATMDHFAEVTGRAYHLFDYHGHPQAERVVVLMGSGAEMAHETVDRLCADGERVGLLRVRLYRPFSVAAFTAALPESVTHIAVLDRTKEPGAIGEPLYLDAVAALREAHESGQRKTMPIVTGGRYGLSSKEFTPAMLRAVFANLAAPQPRRHFTVGITDDVTHLSLTFDPEWEIESPDVVRAVFFGLGSDGTVGANKNSLKIIGEQSDLSVQGYFVYDSKKAGAITVSHLRFGPTPIRSTYLIRSARFVACHQFNLLDQIDVLRYAEPGATLLLNTPYAAADLWPHLASEVQAAIVAKQLRVFTIDAYAVAGRTGMGRHINTVMQVCFFALSGVLPRDEALRCIKDAIAKSYQKKGPAAVERNFAAVDQTLAALAEVPLPGEVVGERPRPPLVAAEAPDFVQRVTAMMLAQRGDELPVSAFPVDGTWPLGTSQWEKRNLAIEIPTWDAAICIQCNKCTLACPHAAIRAKVYPPEQLDGAPTSFASTPYKGTDFSDMHYTLQVAPEDCTGCGLCVRVCPVKDKSNPRHKAIDMVPQAPLREAERDNFAFFLDLPEPDRALVRAEVKSTQFLEPLFEYSGACAGCGETPYIKLLTQLFGDRTVIANATGCSSIYGGNLPTTPYRTNRDGRGPAWANSLFEDNAEFGYGIRLGIDKQTEYARELLRGLAGVLGDEFVTPLLVDGTGDEADLKLRRAHIVALRQRLTSCDDARARTLALLADFLSPKSVWLVGGDGWAYDIGFGGLDHVLAMDRDVNVLVLDTEVYSNTGGQQSKATPLGAAAKFAVAGKAVAKKDLGMLAMSYGHIYVASIAFGAKDQQTVRAFLEAESYPGPSLLLAYSHCIAHGYDLAFGAEHQKLAVEVGHWPLYRYDPRLRAQGKNPLQLDSTAPKRQLSEFVREEARFRLVAQQDPERARALIARAQEDIVYRRGLYERMARSE